MKQPIGRDLSIDPRLIFIARDIYSPVMREQVIKRGERWNKYSQRVAKNREEGIREMGWSDYEGLRGNEVRAWRKCGIRPAFA